MLVNTTHGKMDESLLVKKEGSVDNDIEFTTWTEYWLDDELVHRSVHVTLKTKTNNHQGKQGTCLQDWLPPSRFYVTKETE